MLYGYNTNHNWGQMGDTCGCMATNVDTINQYWIWLCLPNGVYIYTYKRISMEKKNQKYSEITLFAAAYLPTNPILAML
jgi:hypothetical protein